MFVALLPKRITYQGALRVGILPRPKLVQNDKKGDGSFRMTKNSPACHSERSEESRILHRRIIFVTLLPNCITYQGALKVGILPRPKARSE